MSEFRDTDRKSLRLDKFITTFEEAIKDIAEERDPQVVLRRYLEAFKEGFDSECVLLLEAKENNEVGVVYKIGEGVEIKEGDKLDREGFIKAALEEDKHPERKVDSEDQLAKGGVTSCCAIRYEHKRKNHLLLLCNWGTDQVDDIESYEVKLAKIIIGTLMAGGDVELFEADQEEHREAVEKAQDDGSRTELQDACERYIDNFCERYQEEVPDNVLSDWLDSMISRLILPGRERLEGITKEEIEEKLSHLDLQKADTLSLFNCFRKEGQKLREKLWPDKLKLPLTILSLSRALAIIAANSDSEDREEWLAKAEGLLKETKTDVEILRFQTEWTLIASRCEVIRRSGIDPKKVDEIVKSVCKQAPSTRESLWKQLSFISEKNTRLSKWGSPKGSINIESLWLKTWFCSHILEEDILNCLTKDSSLSPLGKLTLCYELSIFVLHILHRIKTIEAKSPVIFLYKAEGAIQAFIYLLAQYAHSYCKVPKSIRISNILRRLWEMEAVLYLSRPHHREHIFHSLDVSLLGLFLLHTKTDGKVLMEEIKEKDLLGNWLLASLFHDTGYILSVYDATEKIACFFEETEPVKKEIKRLERWVKRTRSSIDKIIKDEFGEAVEDEEKGLDHGSLSAIHLKYLLSSASPGDKLVERYQKAISAVLEHSLRGKEISGRDSPLSFLLLLCDHLQDWGRARVETPEFRRNVASYLDYPQPLEIDAYRIMAYLALNIEIEGMETIFKDKHLEFCLVYKEPEREHFEPVILWIDASFDLQRVKDIGSLWEQVEFDIVTPKQEKQDLLEMDFAKDFIAETKDGGRLTEWLMAVFDANNEFVGYESEPFERFSIHIPCKKQIDDLRPDRLYAAYIKWKQAREEQQALGGVVFQGRSNG